MMQSTAKTRNEYVSEVEHGIKHLGHSSSVLKTSMRIPILQPKEFNPFTPPRLRTQLNSVSASGRAPTKESNMSRVLKESIDKPKSDHRSGYGISSLAENPVVLLQNVGTVHRGSADIGPSSNK